MPYKPLSILTVFLIALLGLSACSTKPQPIDFGTDDCDYCKMTISDERYGAELVTKKGRIYKFDDLHCIKGFVRDSFVENENISSLWVVDFSKTKTLVPLEGSHLLLNDELKSPMGSNIAAFESVDSFSTFQKNYSGTELKWETYLSQD